MKLTEHLDLIPFKSWFIMVISVYYNLFSTVHKHGNDNLLSKRIFHHHVDFRPILLALIINYFLNLCNFVDKKIWKYFFDVYNVI